MDVVELIAIERAKKIFNTTYANVQPTLVLKLTLQLIWH